MLLENKVAIITGATRGIGRAIALRFAQEGCQIAFTGRSRGEKMIQVEEELLAMGIKAKGYACDGSQLEQTNNLIKMVMEDFGHIDILVNNAGITADSALKRMTEEQWDSVIDTNLKSVWCMTKAVQASMWRQGFGSVINISSVVGIAGNANQGNYAASKAGIIGFTKAMAKEMGVRNIRHNVVAPGLIGTEMTEYLPAELKEGWMKRIPLHRMAEPDEVAKACLFYASDLSSYITGDVMHCCGGLEDA